MPCSATVKEICQNCILPLAGPPYGDYFIRRQADHHHLQMLVEQLLLTLTVQNVQFALKPVFVRPERGQTGFRINIELVFDGSHYELLYKQ